MKKKILGGLLVVAIAAVATFNVNMNSQESELSALMLANVEALANGEAASSKFDCYSILDGSGQSISCSTCQMATGTPPWYHFGSTCVR